MDASLGTQLITAGSTLGGVVLTLLVTAFLERRRAADARDLEQLKLSAERAKWLRDERRKTYTGLSAAGEEVLQFFRADLAGLVGSDDPQHRERIESGWHELRAALRKAFNQVELLGTDDVRSGAVLIWRTARNGGNDFMKEFQGRANNSTDEDRAETVGALASRLGTVGDQYLAACRKDLQGEDAG